MKFNVNGRETEDYYLSNNEMIDLLESDRLTEEQRKFLTDKVISRFKYELCKQVGETNDNVFVRQFSNFVNGKMQSKTKVAELMANEHRYLQNEMFKVCLAYIQKLAENADKSYYDGRNEWACKTSKIMIDHLKEIDYWF